MQLALRLDDFMNPSESSNVLFLWTCPLGVSSIQMFSFEQFLSTLHDRGLLLEDHRQRKPYFGLANVFLNGASKIELDKCLQNSINYIDQLLENWRLT